MELNSSQFEYRQSVAYLPLWQTIRVFPCPYRKKQTKVPGATPFTTIFLAKASCQACSKEFIVIDNVPLTQEQYRESNSQ